MKNLFLGHHCSIVRLGFFFSQINPNKSPAETQVLEKAHSAGSKLLSKEPIPLRQSTVPGEVVAPV